MLISINLNSPILEPTRQLPQDGLINPHEILHVIIDYIANLILVLYCHRVPDVPRIAYIAYTTKYLIICDRLALTICLCWYFIY